MIKKIIYSLIITLIFSNIVLCESIIFKDNTGFDNTNKIIVYENGEFINIYNYSEPILINDTSEYIFIINQGTLDLLNNDKFILTLFKEYGYLIISIIGLIILLGLFISIYKKSK